MLLLALDSDVACTSLSGHSVRKCSVLDLVWCYKAPGDREQVLWMYWPPKRCIKQWYDKPTGYGCLCKKCGLGEQWSSDIPVSHTLYMCSVVQYANRRLRNISDQHRWPECPLMYQKLSASFTVPQVLQHFVSLLLTFVGREDMELRWIGPMAYHSHTRFHYSKLLT
jgi:hypothetical protein